MTEYILNYNYHYNDIIELIKNNNGKYQLLGDFYTDKSIEFEANGHRWCGYEGTEIKKQIGKIIYRTSSYEEMSTFLVLNYPGVFF